MRTLLMAAIVLPFAAVAIVVFLCILPYLLAFWALCAVVLLAMWALSVVLG